MRPRRRFTRFLLGAVNCTRGGYCARVFRPPERRCARAIFCDFMPISASERTFQCAHWCFAAANTLRARADSVGAPTTVYTCTACGNSYQSCTQQEQSRHLASSIIAMPSVMFKDIGKACSGALAHASEAVRLKAKSCSVVGRVRALLRRSAQQGLQDWQVDGRAEDEDARGARTRRRHQARWGAARQPQPRFRVRRRSRRMAARTTRAHSPAASSSSTRR